MSQMTEKNTHWVVHMIVGGYREPYYNEPRHHWIHGSVTGPAGTGLFPAVFCAHCAMIMPLDGSHRRICFASLCE